MTMRSEFGFLIPDVDYIDKTLSVAYRASEEPQELLFEVQFSKPREPRVTLADINFDLVRRGIAGDQHFDPAKGALEILEGDPNTLEPSTLHSYRLRVAHVSPLFIRQLATFPWGLGIPPNPPNIPERITIRGSLPLDDSPLSVREGDIVRWLRDPQCFSDAWEKVDFKVTQARVRRGLTIRLRLTDVATEQQEKVFEEGVGFLSMVYMCLPNFAKDGDYRLYTLLPSILRGERELSARYGFFDVDPTAAADHIINYVHRFSKEVAPVQELVLGAPW